MTVASRERLNWRLRFLNRPFSTAATDFFVFGLGACTSFSLHLIGDFPIAELILTPLAPIVILIRLRRANRPDLKKVLALMALWLIGQVVSDIYHGTAAYDWMRGDASILFFALDLVTLMVLLGRNEERKILFITGLAIGVILQTRFAPTIFTEADSWKFGYSQGAMQITLLISCFFYRRRIYSIAGALILGIITVNLMLNYRGPVLDLLVTIALVFPVIPDHISRLTILPRAGSAMRAVVLALLAMGAGVVANGMIHLVTISGLLSQESQAKNEVQSHAGNLLLGGRPEFTVGLQAALDSPIIGRGAWAKDYKYVEMFDDMQTERDAVRNVQAIEETSNGQIPGHSALITAWVWSGILGAIFWAYIMWLLLKGISRISLTRPWNAPLYAWIFVSAFWDVLFSPFAFTRRMTVAFTLVVVLDLLEPVAAKIPAVVKLRNTGWRRMPIRGRALVSRWDGRPGLSSASPNGPSRN
jgi:hypothetical protein